MRRERVFGQLFLSNLIVTFLVLIGIGGLALLGVRDFYLEQTYQTLETKARLVALEINELLDEGATPSVVDSKASSISLLSGTRVTVIKKDGLVIADSDAKPPEMDNHADRPEIMTAFSGGVGRSVRYSRTVKKDMVYLSIELNRFPDPMVLRLAVPVQNWTAAMQPFRNTIFIGVLVLALLAAATSRFLSLRISRPLESMRQAAQRFAQGDLGHKVPTPRLMELESLANAMNGMAGELQIRIDTIVAQRNQQDAMLASMVEGVMALDSEGKILNLNKSAAHLFELSSEAAVGKSLGEVARHIQLQQFVERVLKSDVVMEEEIRFMNEEEHTLQVHGTRLLNAQGNSLGALLVMNDVTRLKRLETVRQDFVANVSHELKTPITSIKGFVETLQNGAMEDKEERMRFLGIVHRQAERLASIIEDLLSLSRLEASQEKETIERETVRIRSLFEAIGEEMGKRAHEAKIEIEIDCPGDLKSSLNLPLITQAVSNLVDNAMKYSEEGGSIFMKGERMNGDLRMSIRDEGAGISAHHLPRLFERFYRVDKARSRKLGGTGLGLAIVKHIAQLHGGRVDVESEEGVGSAFSIYIPFIKES